MSEAALGFVPRIGISPPHGFGTKNHAMLVTESRTILLPWRTSEVFLRPWFDWGVIKAGAAALSQGAFKPETWERTSGAVVIQHEAMTRLACGRTANTYFLAIEFRSGQRVKRLSGFVIPSGAYLRRNKDNGVPSSQSSLTYALDMGTAIRSIAPLALVLDWRV